MKAKTENGSLFSDPNKTNYELHIKGFSSYQTNWEYENVFYCEIKEEKQ